MSEIIIRTATEKDVPEMLQFIRELAEFEHGLDEVTVTEEDLLNDGFGGNKLFDCLVAERDGISLGIAVYFYTYSTWNGKCLYLEDLIVKEKYRSQGVGEVLMKELIGIAKKEKVNRMSWQVLGWNVEAHKFYKRLGASLDNEWLNGRLTQRQILEF